MRRPNGLNLSSPRRVGSIPAPSVSNANNFISSRCVCAYGFTLCAVRDRNGAHRHGARSCKRSDLFPVMRIFLSNFGSTDIGRHILGFETSIRLKAIFGLVWLFDPVTVNMKLSSKGSFDEAIGQHFTHKLLTEIFSRKTPVPTERGCPFLSFFCLCISDLPRLWGGLPPIFTSPAPKKNYSGHVAGHSEETLQVVTNFIEQNTTAVRIESWNGCWGESDDKTQRGGVECYVVQRMRVDDWSLIASSEQESADATAATGDTHMPWDVARGDSYIDRCSVANCAHASYCIQWLLRHRETVSWGWRIVSEL